MHYVGRWQHRSASRIERMQILLRFKRHAVRENTAQGCPIAETAERLKISKYLRESIRNFTKSLHLGAVT